MIFLILPLIIIAFVNGQKFYDEAADAFEQQNKVEKIPQKGVPCSLLGVLEAICVEKDKIKDEVPFCEKEIYPYVCVPIYHVSQSAF